MDPLPPLNKVYSLVVQEESNNVVISPSLLVQDESNVLINSSESRISFCRGKNPYSSKNSSRYFTFCNKTNHIVEFCYKKHEHNKPNSSVNASLGESSEAAYGGNAVLPPFSLNQEQLPQLVSLLQQSNLLPLASSPSTSTSLQPTTGNSPSINTISGIYYVSSNLPSLSNAWIIDSVQMTIFVLLYNILALFIRSNLQG